ncbi:hypothetical protein [Nocardia gipuzkoensis]|uniref:hypothetical protein n=1 Tax=Nocardia gipuzkoensis TaxID=2749991 RepID=UPI00237E1A86|nr:hypothetical protein [Nocardia gipuzkoensis]MDE1672685.1 hypothetical protein [Nocardia gipuzkoensis]
MAEEQSTEALADVLAFFIRLYEDRLRYLTPAEQAACGVIAEVLRARHPEAEKAYREWEANSKITRAEVVVSAIRSLRDRNAAELLAFIQAGAPVVFDETATSHFRSYDTLVVEMNDALTPGWIVDRELGGLSVRASRRVTERCVAFVVGNVDSQQWMWQCDGVHFHHERGARMTVSEAIRESDAALDRLGPSAE